MRTLKALIFALTSLAIAVNPVAAALLPCCCKAAVRSTVGKSERGNSQPACCHVAVQQVRVVPHSCCAKSADSEKSLQQQCCCVKSVPATVEFRDRVTAKRLFDQHWIAAANCPVVSSVAAPPVGGGLHSPNRSAVAGPALRVLYCIWLI
jgi:hypothetical protein